MRVLSEIPFTFAPVPGRIGFPRHSLSLVVKGTFDLHPNGAATTADEQIYPSGDEYAAEDEDRAGPLRFASDFVPLKPATDLFLVGTCHAPGADPVIVCQVAWQVGEHRRALRVSGDRHWVNRKGQWVASEPEPFTEMPLANDRAFGGEGYPANPAGRGLSDGVGTDGVPRRPLPNIEHADAPICSRNDPPEPAGFGPLSPLWAQRRAKLGTYGHDYIERRWPWFPEDFDWGYFNAAPPALQYQGYLRGDEPLLLESLHPDHPRYASRLPGLRVRCFVTRPGEDSDDRFQEVEMNLDTLWIDADRERLVLVWRGWTPVADEDFEEIREVYIVAEPTDEESRPIEHYRCRLAEQLVREAAGQAKAGAASAAATPEPDQPQPGANSASEPESYRRSAERPTPDPELGALLDGVVTRVKAATGLDLSTFDLANPEAAAAKVREYLRSQGIDPDCVPDLTPEQRRAQADIFEGLGIPWDPIAGAPNLARLQTVDVDALLRRMLGKLDADLEARGLTPREPPPLTAEDTERLKAIGIDPDALLAYLKSQVPTPETRAGMEPLDRDGVQTRAAGGQSLAGADLSGLDLSGLDLAAADLSGANLTGSKLAGTLLAGADLSGATLAAADLAGARLLGARLSEADLTGAVLSGADATGADLTGVVAEGCLLREARLYRATATGAYLARADLGDARARGLRLDAANLRGACLDGADLRRASLCEARLNGASAVGALFDYADLTGLRASDGVRLADASFREASGSDTLWMDSDLTGADLSYARLPEADFTRAVLAGARLNAADLRQSRLRKAQLQGAAMTETNLFQASLERADLSGADLSGSNLYGAELLGTRLEETETAGANLRRTKLEGRGS